MQLEVLCFALARQLARTSRLVVEVDDPATVAAVREAIARASPALGALMPSVRIAVGGEYVLDTDLVPPGAEVALIPPVSGGR